MFYVCRHLVSSQVSCARNADGVGRSLGRLQDDFSQLLRDFDDDGRPVFFLWDEAQRWSCDFVVLFLLKGSGFLRVKI